MILAGLDSGRGFDSLWHWGSADISVPRGIRVPSSPNFPFGIKIPVRELIEDYFRHEGRALEDGLWKV